MAKSLAEPGTSSVAVQQAQKLLNQALRQSRVPENGSFDKATEEAIRSFQQESGIRVTGVLDQSLMDLLKKASQYETPNWQITLGSKVYLLTNNDRKALIERIKKDFRIPMIKLRSAVEEARIIYDEMKKLNDDQYIVSFFINAYNRKKLPAEGLVKTAESDVAATEKVLNAGNFTAFAALFPRSEKSANLARKELKGYCEGIIDGAGDIQTGLEFVSTVSFTTVAIIGAPVVASSLGVGAIAAGVVAGAGTSAVESLANEAGKGIAGTSGGFRNIGWNVLKDSAIGGLVGAFMPGKGSEMITKRLGPLVAKQLGGKFFAKASQRVVVKWIGLYFKNNGASILEGILTDTLKAYKSNATGLTVDKFLGIVAKQVLTAGVFAKLSNVGDVTSKQILSRLSSKVKLDLIKSLGPRATEKELEPIFSKVIEEFSKESGGKIYDKILDSLTGKETPEQIERKLVDEMAMNKKLQTALQEECEKVAKKKK